MTDISRECLLMLETSQVSCSLHIHRACYLVALAMTSSADETPQVLPIAVTRWLGFDSKGCSRVPWAATVFADLVFASSGLLNVILFTVTRPNLRPHRDVPERTSLMMTPLPEPSRLSTTTPKSSRRDPSEGTDLDASLYHPSSKP